MIWNYPAIKYSMSHDYLVCATPGEEQADNKSEFRFNIPQSSYDFKGL